MEAILSRQRIAPAIAAFAVGIAVSWLAKTPFGLLAPMAALFAFARGRTMLLLHAALAIGLVGSLFVAAFFAGATRDFAVTWSALLAVTLCVGALVATSASASLNAEALQAMRIVESMPAYTWSASADGRLTYVSASTLSYAGESGGGSGLFRELDNAGWRRIVHPDDYARLLETRRHSMVTGDPYDTEFRIRRHDGVFRWFRCCGSASRDQRGRVVGWYGTMIDIEEQKQAEAALRDRERELSQLVDMVPSHLWRLTPEGEPNFYNKRLIDFLGPETANADRPGMSRLAAIIEAAVHPGDAASLGKAIKHSLATGERFSMKYRLRRADGVHRWVEGRAEPLRDESGRIVQWYGLAHDIDDQVHGEEALRDRERQLQQLVDALPASIWSTTRDGTPTYRNKRHSDVTGATLEDVTAHNRSSPLAVIAHPDDRAAAEQVRARAFATGSTYVVRYRQIRRDGSYRWTESRAEPLRDDSGEILQWYGVSIDIHDMVAAQEALRERERELQQLVDALPTQIWAAKADGEPSYLNRRLAEYVGLTLRDLDARDMSRLQMAIQSSVHPDDAAAVGRALVHAFATGDTFAMKYRQRRADGVYRWINGRAEPLRDASGQIVQWYGVSFDIDDDVRTEDELRRTQERLAVASQAASLAELSASIAHEVNQPLAAIVANSHACHRWLSAEPANVERAKITAARIIRDANAAADVVSRIRALFRQSIETRTSATLGSVIAEARDLMAEEATRRRVRMEADVESNLPPVAFDRVQIQQVLINLIRNGMDAMDSGTDDRVLGIRVRRTGDAIRTDISDRGPGIAFPDKIFEPFFTTKAHGMGMGLAICRSIVESHGGRLWVERNEPHGATFIFTLPIETPDAS
jgi:PAS domain S-box-containing protein